MMKKALIDEVWNVVEVARTEDIFPVAAGFQWVECPDECEAYLWTFDGSNVVAPEPRLPPPPPPAPTSVTMRQARLALLGAGLLSSVDAAVAAMAGIEGDAARIEWEYAATVERNSPLVAGLSAALNLTTEQLDALFTAAAGL